MSKVSFTILVFLFAKDSWTQSDTSASRHKRAAFTGIPILNYNGSYGFILGANAMAFFHVNRRDTISPASQAGIGGGYTENRSWFTSLFTQLYFNEDRWRVTAAAGFGKINFQYFEEADDTNDGSFADYGSVNRFIFLSGLRKIKGPFYGGLLVKFQHSHTEFDAHPDSTLEVASNGIGGSLLLDSRDKIYNPSKGWFISATFLSNVAWLGSDSLFSSIRFFVNKYLRINTRSVLASRFSLYTGLGRVPFSSQRAVGGKDIRGYTDGKYRGNQVYAVQTEYRWNFYRRWGAVAFTGLAFTGNPPSSGLPGAGIGIRFLALRTHNINIGVDAAIGKDDNGLYFRINEAF